MDCACIDCDFPCGLYLEEQTGTFYAGLRFDSIQKEDGKMSEQRKKTEEEKVVDLLKQTGLTMASAESCTGGMVASRIVNVPGASEVFMEGFVTYTEKAKRKRLHVKKKTLKKETAVSAKTAKEMARGGCQTAKTQVCVSITGYAGPDGGTEEKPVGTVFIGCCCLDKVKVKEYHFEGSRSEIRQQSAQQALILVKKCLKKVKKK